MVKFKQLTIFDRHCIVFLFLLFANCSLLFGLDFSLRPKAFVSLPAGKGNTTTAGDERYKTGGGGEVGLEIDLTSFLPNPFGIGYSAGLEGGVQFNPLQGDNQRNISFYTISAAAGVNYFPLSRLFTRIDGALGMYASANQSEKSVTGMFLRYGGEVGFRFTPGFILAANAGWRQFGIGTVRNSGIYTGITAQFTFQTGSGTERQGIGAELDQYGELFPVFMQLYQTNPIGNVVLHNNENAEIRNVRMFFRASGYTASEFPSGSVSIIPKGQSAQLPLYADFSPEILRFTDTGRIVGELVIRYTFLGQQRETVRAVSIAVFNRNMVTAGGAVDPASFAAFISPTSPETLDFARYIAGLSRADRRTGHNNNMHYAMWLLEGLRASNIRLGETYKSANEAQFPAETLSFGTGSSRDLALLFAAALEGVGISSAFIQTEDEFLVAVNLEIDQNEAETLFNGTGRILIINNEVWLPLSMSAFNSGFMACWDRGVNILNRVFSEGRQADFVIVEEAWASYPPAPLPELGSGVIRTDNEAAAREVNRAMQAYITQEINPLITRQTGVNTAAGQNRLGILLVRAGRIDEGKTAYERAASMGSVPAMTNRGNLALIEGDFAAAERWFRQALQIEPQNRAALRGMERVQGGR